MSRLRGPLALAAALLRRDAARARPGGGPAAPAGGCACGPAGRTHSEGARTVVLGFACAPAPRRPGPATSTSTARVR